MEAICRICLGENIPMETIANTELQEIYQKLTSLPFKAETPKPLLACHVCLVYLRKAHKLMVMCLRAEQYLECVLYNEDQKIQYKPMLTDITPKLSYSIIEQINVESADYVSVKQEGHGAIHVVYKEEPGSDDDGDINQGLCSVDEDSLDVKNLDILESISADNHSFNKIDDDKKNDDESTRMYDETNLGKNDWKLKNCVVMLEDLNEEIAKRTSTDSLQKCNSHQELKTFINKNNNKRDIPHLTGEKPHKSDQCKKALTQKSGLKTHNAGKQFNCDMCQKSFAVMCNLQKHILTHTGERPHKCDVCQKSFARKDNLINHTFTHTSERPHKCHLCKRSFVEKRNLIVHIRSHTGEKPYKCDLCQKSCANKKLLITHIRIHTGQFSSNYHSHEETYECDVCQKSFAQKYSLLIHMRTHTGERPFSCDICQKSYTQKKILNTHILTHEQPYKCDECLKTFGRKYHLLNHIRTHESPYKCDKCDKTFVRKYYLNSHILGHNGELPHTL